MIGANAQIVINNMNRADFDMGLFIVFLVVLSVGGFIIWKVLKITNR